MEKLIIEIPKGNWQAVLDAYNERLSEKNHLKAGEDYLIKDVKIEDDFFKDDPAHLTLRHESYKAYKALKDYEFNQRHK